MTIYVFSVPYFNYVHNQLVIFNRINNTIVALNEYGKCRTDFENTKTEEIAAFGCDTVKMPDPQSASSFEISVLKWSEVREIEYGQGEVGLPEYSVAMFSLK